MSASSSDPIHHFLSGGGEMGELIRNKDWHTTPIGDPSAWPQNLKTQLQILINCKFPMFLFWGDQLTCFYNDAFRPSLGSQGKHPSMLGQAGETAWSEIWPVIKPLIDQVLSGEGVWREDQLIPIFRNGRMEDVYWTFSYSPLYDNPGKVAGVLVICNETTGQITSLKELQAGKDRYFDNIVKAPVAMSVLSGKDHVVEIANDLMLELWGTTEERVFDKPIFEGLPEAKGQGLEQLLDHVYETGERFSANERPIYLPRNGTVQKVYINFIYDAIRDTDGNISGVVVIASDVTLLVNARKKVEESEKRFRNVADSAPVMIWMSTPDKRRSFYNEAWLIFSGRTLEQELTSTWGDNIHPDDRQRCLDIFNEAFDNQQAFYMEYRLKRHDGAYRWIFDKGVPSFSTDGVFEGYIGACMDIHEQNIFQKSLKSDEERLNVIISASQLGTWELNLKTRDVKYSDRYLEILGGYKDRIDLSHEEIVSHLHPDDLHIRTAAFKEAFETGFLNYQSRLIWRDQSIHWMEGHGKVIYDEEQTPSLLIGTVRDITDEKNYQQRLQEREQKFRLLADSMPQFIWTGDVDGNLNYFNQSVFMYSGLTPEQIRKYGWLQIVHPDDREENIKIWLESVSSGTDFHFEHRFRRHDGVYRWQLSRAIPQRDENGVIQMWVGTSTDIQDQKMFTRELEEQVRERTSMLRETNVKLETSVAELQRMNSELQSFTYVASHDLQEPLRKIQTFASHILLKENQTLSDSGKYYFQRMQDAAERMQTLIEDLLSYSRTNMTERVFTRTNLYDIVNEVLIDLQETIIEKLAAVEVQQMCEAKIIPFQFKQLMYNLVGNALKFSKPGTPPYILIKSRLVSGDTLHVAGIDPMEIYCHLTISDNGIGFDKQYSDRIFEVFQRLHGKTQYKGTGIGLAIVKKIVENHDGVIVASSEPGQGATFDIYFPAS